MWWPIVLLQSPTRFLFILSEPRRRPLSKQALYILDFSTVKTPSNHFKHQRVNIHWTSLVYPWLPHSEDLFQTISRSSIKGWTSNMYILHFIWYHWNLEQILNLISTKITRREYCTNKLVRSQSLKFLNDWSNLASGRHFFQIRKRPSQHKTFPILIKSTLLSQGTASTDRNKLLIISR